jgi:ribosomal protein L22
MVSENFFKIQKNAVASHDLNMGLDDKELFVYEIRCNKQPNAMRSSVMCFCSSHAVGLLRKRHIKDCVFLLQIKDVNELMPKAKTKLHL